MLPPSALQLSVSGIQGFCLLPACVEPSDARMSLIGYLEQSSSRVSSMFIGQSLSVVCMVFIVNQVALRVSG